MREEILQHDLIETWSRPYIRRHLPQGRDKRMWSKLEAGRKGADATNLILAQGSESVAIKADATKGTGRIISEKPDSSIDLISLRKKIGEQSKQITDLGWKT